MPSQLSRIWPLLVAATCQRGPDAFANTKVPTPSPIFKSQLLVSVLSLRGNQITPQPVAVSQDSLFCWNGEVYQTHSMQHDEILQQSDTALMANLVEEVGFRTALNSIEGEYATVFVDSRNGCWKVGMARDRLGRRSLVWHREADLVVVCSIPPIFSAGRTSESDSGTDKVDTDAWRFEEMPADSIFTLEIIDDEFQWSAQPHPTTLPALNLEIPQPDDIRRVPCDATRLPDVEIENEDVVRDSMDALSDAVRMRVLSAPSPKRAEARIAILFSGGLDSTVLAYYAHLHLPPSEPIDLLNVAFENPRIAKAMQSQARARDMYDVPDRLTGRKAVAELRCVAPDREWRFVEINVSFEEMMEYRPRILNLMVPLNSVMDLSIALAFWFAARGRGIRTTHSGTHAFPLDEIYESKARVLLSGLGADEQLGGYARHQGRFQTQSYAGLIHELALDIDRLPYRNLGRDDRIMADHGREVRFPFLDEHVMRLWAALPVWRKCDLRLGKGVGDKLLLRWVAERWGLRGVALEVKRAVQFGSRTAKMLDEDKHLKGGDAAALDFGNGWITGKVQPCLCRRLKIVDQPAKHIQTSHKCGEHRRISLLRRDTAPVRRLPHPVRACQRTMVRIQSTKKDKPENSTGLPLIDETFREYLLENVIRDLGKLQVMGWITNTAFDILMQRLQLERSDPKGAATAVEIAPHAAGPTPYQPPLLAPLMGKALGGPQPLGLPGPSASMGAAPRMLGPAPGPATARAVPPPPMIAPAAALQYVAVADFATGDPTDLELRAGDVIVDVEEVDENWFRGRCGPRSGIFPKTYVQRSRGALRQY
ncbi:hypothetical protein SeLEV6574_g03840 [Synchytrium endobioticum]|uniref:SH3 domain-containing protein n=1 Tax=Synchytrium endobioticum TaxID=286115 RepID=A0A507D209_9FUNG|nr:hypothetical protein SeLEV6574_g03827 [Synchytrium endobioticum]TPX45502.1 hypothetical protein SeLEV6574_g03840 [Synchytrium endobioticum]